MDYGARLPFFPVPAEGETVFSVVGRCAERLGIANRELMLRLTGQRYPTTLFSVLPGHLHRIAATMPNGHPWQNVEVIVRAHTGLSYFTYFHPAEKRSQSVRELTASDSTQPLAMRLGLATYRINASPDHPRFCLQCAREQSGQYGFSYFRTEHQLPGIATCWKHGDVLSDGCVHCGPYPLAGKKLTMPGQCLCSNFKARQLSPATTGFGATWLARATNDVRCVQDRLENRIEILTGGVFDAGFNRGSLIDYFGLAEAIETHLGKAFLESISHPAWTDGRPSAWLRRFFSHGRTGRRLPTLTGLLIAGAVFGTVEKFEAQQPIRKLALSATSDDGEPIVSVSHWKAHLAQSLQEHQFRISSCAASLGLSPNTVAIEARDQGIIIPLSTRVLERLSKKRLSNIKTKLKQGIQKKEIQHDHAISEWTLLLIELSDPTLRDARRNTAARNRRQKHRDAVLGYLARRPSAGRSEIMEHLAGAYDFLITNDKEWFQSTVAKSPRSAHPHRKTRRDWGRIDRELERAIRQTAKQMLNSEGKPTRITATGLLSRLTALQRVTSKQQSFPKSIAALSEVSESREAHLLRKVSWAIKQLIAGQQDVTMDKLRRTAGVPEARLRGFVPVIRALVPELGGRLSKRSKLHG